MPKMLTNIEALKIIKQYDECFVVWADDNKMILSVNPISYSREGDIPLKVLKSMKSGYDGPTRGRFLKSKDATINTLYEVQAEIYRQEMNLINRNNILMKDIDELVALVVKTRLFSNSKPKIWKSDIIEWLYKIYGAELTPKHIKKLDKYYKLSSEIIGQTKELKDLDCYLAVLQNDPQRLKNHWERYYRSKYIPVEEFLEAAGDLAIEDEEIIASIVDIVKNSFMFSPRYLAMLALGKIGPKSGKCTASVIVENIYDSSKHVTTLRNLVVDRILKPIDCWIQCDRCNKGYLKDYTENLLYAGYCKRCLGLGHILRNSN